MQAHRGRQFMVDHSLISLAIFGLLVSGATVFITLGLTGDLPTFSEGADDAAVAAPASVNIPEDRAAIGPVESGQLSLGNAYHPALGEGQLRGSVTAGEHGDELARLPAVESAPSLDTQPGGIAGPGAGLNEYRLIEQYVQLPGVHAPGAGPGEGLNDYRFIDQNVDLAGGTSQAAGPGEGLNEYRFIEENAQHSGVQSALAEPGEGLNEVRSIEATTQLSGVQPGARQPDQGLIE